MEDFEMIENGSSQMPAIVAAGALPSTSTSFDLESPSVPDGGSFPSAGLLEQSMRIVITSLILVLLFPLMLTLSLWAMLVACVFGVPLCGSSSSHSLGMARQTEIHEEIRSPS
jgi:hypothetical protein